MTGRAPFFSQGPDRLAGVIHHPNFTQSLHLQSIVLLNWRPLTGKFIIWNPSSGALRKAVWGNRSPSDLALETLMITSGLKAGLLIQAGFQQASPQPLARTLYYRAGVTWARTRPRQSLCGVEWVLLLSMDFRWNMQMHLNIQSQARHRAHVPAVLSRQRWRDWCYFKASLDYIVGSRPSRATVWYLSL